MINETAFLKRFIDFSSFGLELSWSGQRGLSLLQVPCELMKFWNLPLGLHQHVDPIFTCCRLVMMDSLEVHVRVVKKEILVPLMGTLLSLLVVLTALLHTSSSVKVKIKDFLGLDELVLAVEFYEGAMHTLGVARWFVLGCVRSEILSLKISQSFFRA